MPALKFTVDAALLRELGERLVGAPHIALAELIKNAYDADATKVAVRIHDDVIEIVDNGHGMDTTRFRQYWMRIGSPHKAAMERSPRFGRPLTGSKGVGRLAAQFLAGELELATRATSRGHVTLATVDWSRAVRARELTEAEAMVNYHAHDELFADRSRTGTRLTLRRLHQKWDADALRDLGRELWSLQPPFGRSATGPARAEDFAVDLETSDAHAQAEFENQMRAVLRLWEARIRGRLVEREDTGGETVARLEVTVTFDDGTRHRLVHEQPLQHLDGVSFDVRVFSLHHRQRYRIRVSDARDYLRAFGGVHIYDAGFHLPYYGPDTDWLGIEQAHAHRLSQSKLLPERWQVPGGLEYLPTNSRLYGVVEVDTGHERAAARRRGLPVREALTIQVSRDRLVGNAAFRELRDVVRLALDFYATRMTLRVAATKDAEPPGKLLDTRARNFEEVIDSVRDELPGDTRDKLVAAAHEIERAAESEAQEISRQAGLLGALATAGIAAVAYEHEAARQLGELERLRRRLARTGFTEAKTLADELGTWIQRARATRRMFGPLLDETSRDDVRALRARSLLEQVEGQTKVLLRSVRCDFDGVDAALRLPQGTYAEWSALWQNVFVNAANAMLDNDSDEERLLTAISRVQSRGNAVVLMDTGRGIDLEQADGLFEPFARGLEISMERRGLGAGGTGLGLTIVRMIARKLHCEARFVPPPDARYATAFELSWRSS